MHELLLEDTDAERRHRLYNYCEKLITDHARRNAGQKTMHELAQDFADRYGEEHPLLGREPVMVIVKSMMGTELDLTGYRTVVVRNPQHHEFPAGFETEAKLILDSMSPQSSEQTV